MRNDLQKYHRHSIRMEGYDYTQPGAYFVTICTARRAGLFGEIIDGTVRLSPTGKTVEAEWQRLPRQFPNIHLDAFVVMPNHIHGVIMIVGATHPPSDITVNTNDGSPLQPHPNGPPPGSLGAIIGQFKSRATKRIWAINGTEQTNIWQRNYYERIIRDENEFNAIRVYIQNNPMNWEKDQEYR